MIKKVFLAGAALVLSVTSVLASQFGTRDEAVAMVERAVTLYEQEGIDALKAAVEDTDNPDFHDRDLYVFVNTIDGVWVAHGVRPSLNGQDMRGVRDASGDYFGLRIVEAAQANDRSWVDYVWMNPVTGQEEVKSSYVASVDGQYLLGVGIYLEHQPE